MLVGAAAYGEVTGAGRAAARVFVCGNAVDASSVPRQQASSPCARQSTVADPL
jgi:hypothetical protein